MTDMAPRLAASGYPRKPHLVFALSHTGSAMSRDRKRAPRQSAAHSPLTELFRRNLERLMAHDQDCGSQLALGKVAKVGQTSVGRILRGEQSPTLDIVYRLARALGVEPWQLLVPGLEPDNLPITKQSDERLRELLSRFSTAAQDLARYDIERKH